MKNCSNPLQLLELTDALIDGLKAELFLTPKPGLVDLRNSGSHSDLSLEVMARSISLMRIYLRELAAALVSPSRRPDPVAIGQKAERRMYDTLQTNCHRGGIFLCGLLVMAASRCDMRKPELLQRQIAICAAELFADRERLKGSHGDDVRRNNPRSGIVAESLAGLPGLFELVLPYVDGDLNNTRGIFRALAELMLGVDDSTSRHRCGERGISMLRAGGAELKACLLKGHDPVPLLIEMDTTFKQHNMTMGGVADLLGAGLGYASFLYCRA